MKVWLTGARGMLGSVIAAANDLPDNPIGTKDAQQPLGNHVVIRASESIYVYVGHLQRGSVLPKTGDTVRQQQPIGKCGNSGNSDFPHVHLHIQDTPTFNVGRGQNPVFGPINVELNGKAFAGVSWPLIRGLFVSNAAQ